MQNVKLLCTLDGSDYKEYKVEIDEQTLGLISWNSDRDPSTGNWYTTASDGETYYFHTQEAAINFLQKNPVKSASDISTKLKVEAHKLIDIAEEIELEGTVVINKNL
ncbi:hypothetical protein [Aliterella atlantica]|uniref:Uncharacterized protein n=1 Tax=Aliterella atlantica CENA595 TaxID=1618023 RepID=A0A0D8ZNI4_9CYAN|nr:hypothetical protein [Aliterella atlantica]KJH70305.1 hypothetical protein UH38_18490 [Aliterella atlantica CENA595]